MSGLLCSCRLVEHSESIQLYLQTSTASGRQVSCRSLSPWSEGFGHGAGRHGEVQVCVLLQAQLLHCGLSCHNSAPTTSHWEILPPEAFWQCIATELLPQQERTHGRPFPIQPDPAADAGTRRNVLILVWTRPLWLTQLCSGCA